MSGGRPRFRSADAGTLRQARKLLTRYGLADDVRVMDRHLRGTPGRPTVVVVGEVKRGKSTLVNALAGADVSPTGPEVVTTGAVAVVPPSATLPAGLAELMYAGRAEVVPADQAATALTPGSDRERPLGATFAVESRWLQGLALVDTPGVGGLSSAHGRNARRAAAEAAALLFVSDGGQTLTAPELSFLSEVSEHTEHVVLALTKVDRNPGSWEQVLAENRALLRRHAPRFAALDIHPVSAAYAVHARSQPPDLATALVAASGVPALASALREVVADRDRLAAANALRAGHSGLVRLEERVDLQLRAMGDAAVTRDLEAEGARLAELQHRQRRARLDLERDLGRIRQEAVEHLNVRADELTARMSQRIRQERRGMTSAAKDAFAAELAAELNTLATEVRDLVGARLTALVESSFGSLDGVPADEVGAQLTDVPLRVRTRASTTISPLVDPSVASSAFLGSHLLSLGGIAGGPLGMLVGGGAMVAANLFFRGARQGQQELAGTLLDSVAGARSDLVAAVDSWLRELRPELHIALEEHLRQSVAAVRAVIATAKRAAEEDAAARSALAGRVEERLKAVQTLRRAVEGRLQELASREHSEDADPPTSTRPPFGPALDPQIRSTS